MSTATLQTLLIWAAAAALIAWRMHVRIRRMIGRQKFSKVRPWLTVTLFPLLLVAMLPASLGRPADLEALLGGAVAGIALGVFGLRLTKFEKTAEGGFYTPNAHLGVALSVLLICRVGYRVVAGTLYGASAGAVASASAATSASAAMAGGSTGAAAAMPGTLALSPLTLLLFGTLAGYYVTYAVGLLRWHHRTG